MMTVRNILHWFFSFPQAIASDADRAERGFIGAKSQQDFAPGGLGEISPNKQQVYVHLPCLARLAETAEKPGFAMAQPLHFSHAQTHE